MAKKVFSYIVMLNSKCVFICSSFKLLRFVSLAKSFVGFVIFYFLLKTFLYIHTYEGYSWNISGSKNIVVKK